VEGSVTLLTGIGAVVAIGLTHRAKARRRIRFLAVAAASLGLLLFETWLITIWQPAEGWLTLNWARDLANILAFPLEVIPAKHGIRFNEVQLVIAISLRVPGAPWLHLMSPIVGPNTPATVYWFSVVRLMAFQFVLIFNVMVLILVAAITKTLLTTWSHLQTKRIPKSGFPDTTPPLTGVMKG
jgi:hypothetical protein